MKKIKNRIVFVGVIAIIGLNLFSGNKLRESEIDLDKISAIAIATGETDPDEVDPIIRPTSWMDWLGELIGM